MSYVRVYAITDVQVAISESTPSTLAIGASGTVNSSGWTDGQLSEWVYVTPPEDGVLDFDFVAKKPTGIVLWVFRPIHSDFARSIPAPDDFWGPGRPLRGVRIHALTNVMEVPLPGASESKKFGQMAAGDRWPW